MKKRITEIIEAAARVFEQRGFHGATTQDIADELGIRQASVYYYFRSKEAALEQVCLRGVASYVARAEAIARRKGPAAEKLAALIANHLSPLAEQPAYVRVFLRERRHLPDASRHKVGRLARRYERMFEKVIRQGVASGQFRRGANVRLAALGVIGMCNAATAWYGKEPKVSIAAVVAEFSALAIRGLEYSID